MNSTEDSYGSAATYPPLPTGRHLLPRAYIDEYQRRRMVVAAAELAHEEGLAAVTVTGLTERARISRKTFYDYFRNRDECLEYAGKEATAYLFGPLEELTEEKASETRVASAVETLLDAVAAEPVIAEFALIHAPALVGEVGWRFQKTAIDAIAGLLGTGSKRGGKNVPGAETIAIAILGLIAYQVRRGEAERVEELGEEVLRLARLAEAAR